MDNYAVEIKDLNLKYRFIKNMSMKQEIVKLIKRKKDQRVVEVYALKDVSFKVEKGQTVGIIGANGAGKTTLLKTIARIFQPDSGEIKLYSDSVSLLTLGAGFQGELAGVENIYLNGITLGLSKKQIDQRLQQIIDFSGIGEAIHNPIKSYSTGMKARLAFSIACYVEPDILLIDEILGVGDENFKKKSSDKLKELIKDNRTVIIVSHSLSSVREMCDKVLWLDKGKLIEYGETNEIIDKYIQFVNKK